MVFFQAVSPLVQVSIIFTLPEAVKRLEGIKFIEADTTSSVAFRDAAGVEDVLTRSHPDVLSVELGE
jgi:hypothetical protein